MTGCRVWKCEDGDQLETKGRHFVRGIKSAAGPAQQIPRMERAGWGNGLMEMCVGTEKGSAKKTIRTGAGTLHQTTKTTSLSLGANLPLISRYVEISLEVSPAITEAV